MYPATDAIPCFNKMHLETLPQQLEGCRETGDTSANDQNSRLATQLAEGIRGSLRI
jgi:hypothetical protein